MKKAIDTHGNGNYELRITDYLRKVQTNHNIAKITHQRKGKDYIKKGNKKYRLQAFISYNFLFSNL